MILLLHGVECRSNDLIRITHVKYIFMWISHCFSSTIDNNVNLAVQHIQPVYVLQCNRVQVTTWQKETEITGLNKAGYCWIWRYSLRYLLRMPILPAGTKVEQVAHSRSTLQMHCMTQNVHTLFTSLLQK